MEIRSYRAVFDLERRIYRVDRLRLNPGGVPVRTVVYFLGLLGGAFLGTRVPLLDRLAGVLPWYVLDLGIPALVAALLSAVKIEGRPFHLAVRSLARFRVVAWREGGLRARRSIASDASGTSLARWGPPDLLLLPDGSDGRMRRLRYSGPGAVLVGVDYTLDGPSRGLTGLLRPRSAPVGLRLREPALPVQHAGPDAGDSRQPSAVVIALAANASVRVG